MDIEDLHDIVSVNDIGWTGAPVFRSSFSGFAFAVYLEEGQFPLLVARSASSRLECIQKEVSYVDDNELELLDPVMRLSTATPPVAVFHHMAQHLQQTGQGTLMFITSEGLGSPV